MCWQCDDVVTEEADRRIIIQRDIQGWPKPNLSITNPTMVIAPTQWSNLVGLRLEYCEQLTTINLPNLTRLFVLQCPRLVALAPILTKLNRLTIANCASFAYLPPTLMALTHLTLLGNLALRTIPPTLTKIDDKYFGLLVGPKLTFLPYTMDYYIGSEYVIRNTVIALPQLICGSGIAHRCRRLLEYYYHPQRVGGRLSKRSIALYLPSS